MKIRLFLDKRNINFIREWKGLTNNKCKSPLSNYHLRYDFYLPMYNLVISYHGAQHYQTWAFDNHSKSGLVERQYRDNYKSQYLRDNGINQLIIRYDEYNMVEALIDEYLTKS